MGFSMDMDEEVEARCPGLSEDNAYLVAVTLENRFDEIHDEDRAFELLRDFEASMPLREINEKYQVGLSEKVLLEAESIVNPDPPKSLISMKPW